MEKIKGWPLASATSMPNSQAQKREAMDPAKEAGLTRNQYYKNDKWIIGKKGNARTYVVAKNTVPEHLASAFIPSKKADPVTENATYDQKKFELDEWSDSEFKGGRVAIAYRESPTSIADSVIANITFRGDAFVISIPNLPKSGIFPFNKEEFLKVVDAAKWDLELFAMPQSDSDSDTDLEKP